jgi:hypothetical protein
MGGEDQRRLAVVAQLPEPVIDRDAVEDVAQIVGVGLEHLQAIDMGEFGRDASEIVPDAVEDRLDLGRRFLRKGGGGLSRPIRCSLSRGPSLRMMPPARSAMRLRLVARIARSIPTASHPSAVSAATLTFRPARSARRLDAVMGGARGRSSKGDDDLPEHLPAFETLEPALEVGEGNFGIDHRQ